MTGPCSHSPLMDLMPPVRGKMTPWAPLRDMTWLRVGGPAEILFQPLDEDDLVSFLKHCPPSVPLTLIGVGSNLLVRDGGVRGVVIRLGPAFGKITVEGDLIAAGAGALDVNIARAARKAGLAGLEFLVGIPGTLGGALRMNAGAHGREIRDVVRSIDLVTRTGERKTVAPQDMGFAYRGSAAPGDWIFLGATLEGRPDAADAIAARMKEIQDKRLAAQPVRDKTAGSTFANPDGARAWELIDKAGCRGLTCGNAMMSQQHCNFMVNLGEATASDFESLGEEVRRRVKETTGVELRWEVRLIGQPLEEGVRS